MQNCLIFSCGGNNDRESSDTDKRRTAYEKTSIAAVLARVLGDHGIKVSLPPDPERDEKMQMPFDQLVERLKESGVEIMVMEQQTAKHRS